jgi:histidinol-phosphate/aromatic aminotransferase/cobyric acid decarboxylase-like protein
MRSFSKGFGLPAIRIGYIAGNKQLIAQMSSRRPAYETNSLSLWVATWALDNFSLFEDYIKEVISTRDFMKIDLSNRGFRVHGSYSNTILIDLESPEHALNVYRKLKERDVWVRELTEFPNISTWISVTIGNKYTAIKFLESFYSIV